MTDKQKTKQKLTQQLDILSQRVADLEQSELARKRGEEALQESEAKYRMILQSIEDGYYEVDIAGNLTSFNDSLCRMLGYFRDEMIGMNNRQYMTQETANKVYETFNNVYRTGKATKAFGWDLVRKDGQIRYVETSVSPIYSAKNELVGFRGIARDVTERKRGEEALQESEAKYRMILQSIEDGYYEVDIAGNLTSFNDSLCRMLGYSRDEMIGMNNRQYMTQETANKVYETFNNVYRTGKATKAFGWDLVRKDGQIRYVETSVSPVCDVSGKTIGFRGIARDITEHKRAQEQMAALQEELRQSQKMEAIGRLSGGIAHDFNNLLTVIKGYSQLSLMGLTEGDPLRKNIEEIQRSSERADDLTRQLLAFSRRQILEMKVLDLNSIIKDVDEMLHRIIGEDIELVTLLGGDFGRIKTDRGQIEQVLMNLAVNARDAMLNGGILTIETANVILDDEYARTHIDVKAGEYVMLSVSDTGCGITSEVRERVFEPFFTTKEKGTGLGLSTVYGIVKQSGGNIWVYSEPGSGTTFKIYLPRVDEPLEELHESPRIDGIPRGNETILIVEDDEAVRKLAVRVLEKQGYTVLEANQGYEALNFCKERKEPVHLILTDVVMPGMNGPQLIESLKEVRQDFKVLYMSGYTDDAIVHHGVLEMGVDFIRKPFTFEGLARKVREVLDKNSNPAV